MALDAALEAALDVVPDAAPGAAPDAALDAAPEVVLDVCLPVVPDAVPRNLVATADKYSILTSRHNLCFLLGEAYVRHTPVIMRVFCINRFIS